MKKTPLLALLLFTTVAFSQEKKEKPDDLKMHVYIGGGFVSNNSFALDGKLANSGIPAQISKNNGEFILGYSLYDKYVFIDGEFSITTFKKDSNSDVTTIGNRANIRGRFHYNFVNNDFCIFSGGLNLVYTTNNLNIYNNNNQVDLNSINTDNSKNIYLRNGMFYIGPSLSFALKSKKGIFGRLNTGYEIALASNQWKSDYGSVSNSVNEIGQNRIMVGGVFYLWK